MSDVREHLRHVVTQLREEGIGFALVGALAVAVRAVDRKTRDIDFVVAVDSNIEADKLVYAMKCRGHHIRESLFHKPTEALATQRFVLAGSNEQRPNLDLLFRTSGIEREVVDAATDVALLDGTMVPVASRAHLIALKTLSESDVRNRDRDDLLRLIEKAHESELEEARAACRLIEERGFHRDKDLLARLEHFQHLLEPELEL